MIGDPQREKMVAETEAQTAVDSLVQFLSERQLLLPAALFVVGHRPLAFVVGQLCLLGLPLALLFPDLPLQNWARVLSHPHALAHLDARLHQSLTNSHSPTTDST